MSSSLSTRPLSLMLVSLIGLGLSSCAVYDGPYGYGTGYVQTMPAVGVGYYDYWYYPSAQVYYDTGRHVYFYMSSNGWAEVRVLPYSLRARLGTYVPIRSRYARPYREHNEHLREYPPHREYPPRYRETPDRHDDGRSSYPYYYQAPPQKTPDRHDGGRSSYPYYQAPPMKKAPYQYEQRQERDNRQRDENRRAPRFELAPPLKKRPAQDTTRSQRKDHPGKGKQDSKPKDNRYNRSDRQRDHDQGENQDRYRRYDQ